MFHYSLDIGDYDADVKVNIEVKIKHGVSSGDYDTLRDALNTIEKLARKYEPEEAEVAEDEVD